MKILVITFFVVLTYYGISIATIIKNGVSLKNDPGIVSRLKVFLSTHRAETSKTSSFPELKTPTYQASANDAISTIMLIAEKKGWVKQSNKDPLNNDTQLHYIITTTLLRFKDDITILVEPINSDEQSNLVAIHIMSESRIGKADFGANLSHITTLINELDSQIPRL